MDDVYGNRFLTLDPNVTGVFNGPYPLGIDPVSTDTKLKWNSRPRFTVNCAPQRKWRSCEFNFETSFPSKCYSAPFVPVQVVNVPLWVTNTIKNWLNAQKDSSEALEGELEVKQPHHRGGLSYQAGFSVRIDLSIQRHKYKGKIDLYSIKSAL